MRVLQNAKIPFREHSYDPEITDGQSVAQAIGTNPDQTFKTLVTVSDGGKFFVFVTPVTRELDLKACARTVGVKSISMIPQKQLLPLTGYVHGGCSPVGMKKSLPVTFDSSCLQFDEITLSAGKKGRQVSVNPNDLISFLKAKIGDFSV